MVVTVYIQNLLHLSKDVLNLYSPLDGYSAFKFENYLQHLKKKANSGYLILEQIYNRTVEGMLNSVKPINQKQLFATKRRNDGTYINYCFGNTMFSVTYPNNYCMLQNKSIARITRISEKEKVMYFECEKLTGLEPLYTYPINSADLGILTSETINIGEFISCGINNILSKVALLSLSGKYFFMSMHNLS